MLVVTAAALLQRPKPQVGSLVRTLKPGEKIYIDNGRITITFTGDFDGLEEFQIKGLDACEIFPFSQDNEVVTDDNRIRLNMLDENLFKRMRVRTIGDQNRKRDYEFNCKAQLGENIVITCISNKNGKIRLKVTAPRDIALDGEQAFQSKHKGALEAGYFLGELPYQWPPNQQDPHLLDLIELRHQMIYESRYGDI